MGNFVEGVRESKADTGRIWDLLVDVGAWPDNFTPHLKEAHLDGELRVGATGWVKTTLPLPRSAFTVTSLDEGRSWEWEGPMLWLTLRFDHQLEATGAGSRVTFDVDLDGPLAGAVRPLARRVYRPQMERALDLLVKRAERY